MTQTFGVFTVTALPDSANVTISTQAGPLFEGLDASDDVGTATSYNDDAPPMTGFAVRDVSTSTTMLYGAFQVVDSPNAPWRVARHLQWAGGAAPLALIADDGSTLATLAFSVTDDPSHLVVDVEPGDWAGATFFMGHSMRRQRSLLGLRRADGGRRRARRDDSDLARKKKASTKI